MRFYEIDGVELPLIALIFRDLDVKLRSIFGIVLQDTWLFNGTIRDNIAYGRLDATDEEIVLAAKATYADGFIRTLPEGYDAILMKMHPIFLRGKATLDYCPGYSC